MLNRITNLRLRKLFTEFSPFFEVALLSHFADALPSFLSPTLLAGHVLLVQREFFFQLSGVDPVSPQRDGSLAIVLSCIRSALFEMLGASFNEALHQIGGQLLTSAMLPNGWAYNDVVRLIQSAITQSCFSLLNEHLEHE